MNTFLKHCLTGKDNETFDIARVLWAVGGLAFVIFTGWAVFHSGVFDAQNYGAGFGLAMGGGGASVWAKAKTEPEAGLGAGDLGPEKKTPDILDSVS